MRPGCDKHSFDRVWRRLKGVGLESIIPVPASKLQRTRCSCVSWWPLLHVQSSTFKNRSGQVFPPAGPQALSLSLHLPPIRRPLHISPCCTRPIDASMTNAPRSLQSQAAPKSALKQIQYLCRFVRPVSVSSHRKYMPF